MKAITKTQMARCAGVCRKTFASWLKPHEKELTQMGYLPGMHCIPPRAVEWIAEKFCIDIEP